MTKEEIQMEMVAIEVYVNSFLYKKLTNKKVTDAEKAEIKSEKKRYRTLYAKLETRIKSL